MLGFTGTDWVLGSMAKVGPAFLSSQNMSLEEDGSRDVKLSSLFHSLVSVLCPAVLLTS